MLCNHPFKTKEVVLETTISEFQVFAEQQLNEMELTMSLFVEKNAKGNKLLVFPNITSASESSIRVFKQVFGDGGPEVMMKLLQDFFGSNVSYEINNDELLIRKSLY